MVRDTLTNQLATCGDDPAQRWAHQLGELEGWRRTAVSTALRESAATGYPADVEGVDLLVAYAQGAITAHQYTARILASFGVAPTAPLVAPAATAPPTHEGAPAPQWRAEPRRAPARPERDSRRVTFDDQLLPQRVADPAAAVVEPQRVESKTLSRAESVQAYVSGVIPVEEFLRLSRSRMA